MKKIAKLILNGFISCVWRVIPLSILLGSVLALIDAHDEVGYWAAMLVFAGVIALISAMLLFLFFGVVEKDYDEFYKKREGAIKKQLNAWND